MTVEEAQVGIRVKHLTYLLRRGTITELQTRGQSWARVVVLWDGWDNKPGTTYYIDMLRKLNGLERAIERLK